jgi:hypothetical protein
VLDFIERVEVHRHEINETCCDVGCAIVGWEVIGRLRRLVAKAVGFDMFCLLSCSPESDSTLSESCGIDSGICSGQHCTRG